MSRDRKRMTAGRRVPGRLAFAVAIGGLRRCGRRRGGGSGELLGRRAAGDADRRTVPAAEARRRRQRPHPDRLERGPAEQGRRPRLVRHRHARRTARRAAGIEVLPFITGAPAWAVPAVVNAGGSVRAAQPAGQDRGRSAPPGRTSLRQAVARYGPNGTFWADNPQRAQAADPHLADLERGELQILRRPAQPGRIREAGEALLHGAQGRRPGAKLDPRRPLRAGPRKRRAKPKPPLAYFATDFLEQMYQQHAGHQGEVQRRRPAPLHLRLPGADPGDRRSARRC